jgi:glutamate N-acetyltransferase/amino-acid N-acetyltransferase
MISDVCAEGGVAASEIICNAVADALSLGGGVVLPSSTGIIGFRLPAEKVLAAIPAAADSLRGDSIIPPQFTRVLVRLLHKRFRCYAAQSLPLR